MKNKILFSKTVLCLFCVLFSFNIKAQQINTQYFMENSPLRHYWNPSFQPISDQYISLPVLGYFQFGISNNSLTMSNVLHSQNGQTVTFLNPENRNIADFYNSLGSTTGFFPDLRLNLFGYGKRTGDASYWNFTLSYRVDGGVGVPKDFMKLLLYGTEKDYNSFNIKSLGANVTSYLELAIGYSRILSNQWTFGGKLKLLGGNINASASNSKFDLQASIENWILNGNGSLRISSPFKAQTGATIGDLHFDTPDNATSFLGINGAGAGIDLGVTFKPANFQNLTLSAALNDLGFLYWFKNVTNIDYKIDNYHFEGLGNLRGSNLDIDQIIDSIGKAFSAATSTTTKGNAYISTISPKLNVAAEYAFLKNKISAGLLSRTMLNNGVFYEELTVSGNFRPKEFFNTSISYSVLGGNFSSIGLGIGLRTGPLHWLLSADYIGFEYAKYDNIPVPYRTKGINLGAGLNIVLCCFKKVECNEE